jgi:hypothetical protein
VSAQWRLQFEQLSSRVIQLNRNSMSANLHVSLATSQYLTKKYIRWLYVPCTTKYFQVLINILQSRQCNNRAGRSHGVAVFNFPGLFAAFRLYLNKLLQLLYSDFNTPLM